MHIYCNIIDFFKQAIGFQSLSFLFGAEELARLEDLAYCGVLPMPIL